MDMAQKSKSSYWNVPTHITGFFRICHDEDPLKKGSQGAGFSIASPMITQASISSIEKRESAKIVVHYNDQPIDGKVSKQAANAFSLGNQNIIIRHYCRLPIGGGFSTSAAGALGTTFSLNEIFETKYSPIELGQIAHRAEVACGTGLGGVTAQLVGGPEIRIQPGAPGYGTLRSFTWSPNIQILSVYFGSIPTNSIITSQAHIQQINTASAKLLTELVNTPNIETFSRLSYQFALKNGLLTQRLNELLQELHSAGYKASMNMIGEAIFVLGTQTELKQCQELITQKYPTAKMWVNEIAQKGPISLDETDATTLIKQILKQAENYE